MLINILCDKHLKTFPISFGVGKGNEYRINQNTSSVLVPKTHMLYGRMVSTYQIDTINGVAHLHFTGLIRCLEFQVQIVHLTKFTFVQQLRNVKKGHIFITIGKTETR